MYEGFIALKRLLGEACAVQSEVWEIMTDLTRMAFGTPMFSRRLDAGYCLCAGATQSRLSGTIACVGRYRSHVYNLHCY